jgi:hypothetical protein
MGEVGAGQYILFFKEPDQTLRSEHHREWELQGYLFSVDPSPPSPTLNDLSITEPRPGSA